MKHLHFLILGLAVLGLLLLPAAAPAAALSPHHGILSGHVGDGNGHGVAHAVVEVELQLRNGHRFHARTFSDRRGHFDFGRVPAGHGQVNAHHPGLGRDRERVRIGNGQHLEVRLVLH